MATTETLPPAIPGDGYKYQWSRYVSRNTLNDDLRTVKARIDHLNHKDSSNSRLLVPDLPADASIKDLYQLTEEATGGGIVPPPDPSKLSVGIVGAGAAGLFTALLFDWLNDHPWLKGKLHIDYDILEANDEDRLGGRLYTHWFPKTKDPQNHDEPAKDDEPRTDHLYYDVGAMRFPKNHIMGRTFRLFDYIGLKEGRGGLIPYYIDDDHHVCPSYYNDVGRVGEVYLKPPKLPPPKYDPYDLNSGLPDDDKIPDNIVSMSPDDASKNALQPILDEVKKLLDRQRLAKENPSIHEDPLWATLMSLDKMSVRQFFTSTDNGTKEKPLPKGPGFNFNTCEWLECANSGNGWYDQALTEAVLEELDFEPGLGYVCVDGGAQKIAQMMRDKVKKQVKYNVQVTAIDAQAKERDGGKTYADMVLKYTETDPTTKQKTEGSKKYFTVFNSTTLGALQRMDLRDAGLLWGTKQAIRSLSYSASTKVAIRFKTPWWQLEPFNINQGGLGKTDLPLHTCVYPSYNIKSEDNPDWSPNDPSVLLCSYTWGQDALRLGALIDRSRPDNEDELKKLMLHDLAVLHAQNGVKYEDLLEKLNEEYIDHHAWDWYKDPQSVGAFAMFGPGQFSNMWQEIANPNSYGQLYLIGEAASAHHAWVVGALESVVRAVYFLFQGLDGAKRDFDPYKKVLELLGGGKDWEPSPFYPLPAEMPKRQLGTERDTEVTNLADADKNQAELSYAAAVVALSQVRSLVEAQLAEGKA